MKNVAVSCPVSVNRINENVARVAAFITIIITITSVYFNAPYLIVALALDFFVRAFTSGKYSPVKIVSRRFADYIGMDEKPADAAPKKFAAAIGFLFSVAIALFLFLHYTIPAVAISTVLLLCAALESFRGFCLGCIIYTYTVLPFLSKRNS